MDEKPNDQHLNSVNDGGNILNSPKPDERTQLDTDIENTQKELSKEKFAAGISPFLDNVVLVLIFSTMKSMDM